MRVSRDTCQLLEILAHRLCRGAEEQYSFTAKIFVRQDAGLSAQQGACLNRHMIANADLTADYAAVADLRASRNPRLRRNHDVGSHNVVMANVHQVVQLGAGADNRLVQRAAVDGAVGADLDVVADDQLADLGKL